VVKPAVAQTTGYKSVGTSFEELVNASNATVNNPGGVTATPQYQNDVQGSIVSGDWFVISGSGTGQLAGLRGEGGFRANLGESARVHLDYWFE